MGNGRTEQWDRVQEIFAVVADLPPGEQKQAVEHNCGGDSALAGAVLRLLEADLQESVLDRNLGELAKFALDADEMRELVHQQIGPYRLLRLLGEGGMGTVYLAERTDIGGLVAIKLLRHAWLSPMRRERFAQEQQTLARLSHSGIARIYDAGALKDGTPWFVMEYVDGEPFTAWALKPGRSLRDDLSLFRQVCQAVQHAHRHAIIHRDLKPSNIMVAFTGEVKLLDFGIARHLEASDTPPERTVDGLRLLTPAYAAPEQIASGTFGVFTDVHALGVLLYELLTGRLPSPEAHLRSGKPPLKPSLAVKAQPGSARVFATPAQWADLDTVCLTALHFDPEQRYASVGALIADLDAFLEGRVLAARPRSLRYAAGKFIRRHRAMLLVSAAAAALLIGATTLFLVRLTQARDAAVHELARRSRIERFTEGLFNGGDPSAGPALQLSTGMLLNRGTVEAEGMGDDPRLQADLFSTLGEVYQRLGQLDRADALLQRTLRERQRSGGAGSEQYAESLIDLGMLRKDQGRTGEAEDLLRTGLETERRKLRPSDLALEHGLWALGALLVQRGDYTESKSLLEEALRGAGAKGPSTLQNADDLSALADVYFYLNDYGASDATNRQALALYRKLLGNNHPSVGRTLNSLGQTAWNRGRSAEAEADFRQALAIDQGWYGPDHPAVAADLTSIAKVIGGAERYGEAHDLLTRALQIQNKTYGQDHPQVALILNELGTLAYSRDQDDEAEGDFREALRIWRKVYGDNHQFVGLCYANLTGVWMDRKKYSEAEATARKALATYTMTLPAEHVSVAIIHVKLGRILLRQGRYADAEPESMIGYRYFLSHETGYQSYLAGARKDLIEIEGDLHRPERVAALSVGSAKP